MRKFISAIFLFWTKIFSFRAIKFKKYIMDVFVCSFDFHLYPFDIQKCYIEFSIPVEERQSIELINATEFPGFWGSTHVNQYSLGNFKYLQLSNETHKLVVQFLMKRQFINVFLTVLIPAILINLVCK